MRTRIGCGGLSGVWKKRVDSWKSSAHCTAFGQRRNFQKRETARNEQTKVKIVSFLPCDDARARQVGVTDGFHFVDAVLARQGVCDQAVFDQQTSNTPASARTERSEHHVQNRHHILLCAAGEFGSECTLRVTSDEMREQSAVKETMSQKSTQASGRSCAMKGTSLLISAITSGGSMCDRKCRVRRSSFRCFRCRI